MLFIHVLLSACFSPIDAVTRIYKISLRKAAPRQAFPGKFVEVAYIGGQVLMLEG
jgi:hypothetical protein